MKWIRRYFRGSTNIGLVYHSISTNSIVGYVNSNYVGNLDK